MKKISLIIFSVLLYNTMISQGFIGSRPDTLFATSRNGTFNKVRVGIGNDAPKEQLHTTDQVRFSGLFTQMDTNIVVQDPVTKNLHIRGISTLGISNNTQRAWLLGGNTNVLTSPDNIIGIMTPSPPLDFRIFNASAQRARYTPDGNYEFGNTNNLINSKLTSISGFTNNSIRDSVVFIYGNGNITDSAKNSGIVGRLNRIDTSFSVLALGQSNRIRRSNQGGVIGEDLRMNFNHGSFMAGGHSLIDSGAYNATIGNNCRITNSSSFVLNFGQQNNVVGSSTTGLIGNNSNIIRSNNSYGIGNNINITNGSQNFAFGSGLNINSLNPNNVFLLGTNITSTTDNSMKLGFNNNRTMTITQRGVDIQMDPSNPGAATPTHNLEVMAGTGNPTSAPEILFRNLPFTTKVMDMVVIDPLSDELYRIQNCCGSSSIQSACSTQFIIPRVDANGSPNLSCSQITDDGTTVGIGLPSPFSGRIFTGTGVMIAGSPAIPTSASLDINGLTFTNSLVVSSDARLKKNIKPIFNALDIVKLLNGVTYNWEKDKYKERNLDNIPQAGFLAQDVEKVYPIAVVKGSDGFYAMNYNTIIPLLNEAIKELNAENQSLKSEVETLKERLATIEKMIGVKNEGLNDIKDALFDPIPNPTNGATEISYQLSQEYSNAYITIMGLDGKVIESFKLNAQKGKASIKTDLSKLASGPYLYSLVAGERVVDSKRLQLTK